MANHASAKKRNRQTQKRSERNNLIRARMRTAIKNARAAIAEKSDSVDATVKTAIREIYRASSRKVLKTETASRKVSRLTKAAATR